MLSPDGQLLVYISNETKRYEVYVRQYPTSDGKRQWQISRDGGVEPFWRKDGKELYFLAPNRTLMAVDVTGTGETFNHRPPRALFPTSVTWLESQAMGRHYAPSTDGERFLIANATEPARSADHGRAQLGGRSCGDPTMTEPISNASPHLHARIAGFCI
jgi:hypothetical protein